MKDTGKKGWGVSLGARIFLISTLLIAVAVGAAVAVTYFRGTEVAEKAAERSLERSRELQGIIMKRDLEELGLIADVLSRDAVFLSYVAEAVGGGLGGEITTDRESILDQLAERRDRLGLDFAILTDPDGLLIARTDRPTATDEDLAEFPLVQEAIEAFETSSDYWLERGQLFEAAAVPLVQGFDLYGVLVIGYAVDDSLASEIHRATDTELAFLVREEGKAKLPASTLSASLARDLLEELEKRPNLIQDVFSGQPVPTLDLQMEGRSRAYLVPLLDRSSKVVGATVGLASLEDELAGYKRILRDVLLAGLAALVMGLLLSYALSRNTMRPVRQLTEAAEAAARGDYGTGVASDRADEVGRLGRAFDSLLSDLREKSDMESYVNDLSRHLPEPGGGDAMADPVATSVALVALELRRYAHPRNAKEPKETLQRLGKDLRRIAAVTSSHHGKVESVSGHRVLARFEGPGCALRGLAAAGELRRELSRQESSFDVFEPPTMALTLGKVASGSAVWADHPSPVMVGLPVQQLETLLREALPGDLVLSREAQREVGEKLKKAGVELVPGSSVLSTQPIFLLGPEEAERLLMPSGRTSVLEPVVTEKSATLSEIAPGVVLDGRFEILSILGAGGMGVVYKARDRELDDLVAVKTLRKQGWQDVQSMENLKSELKLARRIAHPNVLRTFDFGDFGGIPYISMEFVRGLTVRYLLEQTGRLPFSAALRLSRQLCSGLAAAHREGVLHRDIKPENLILDQAGNLKLMDFGIARPLERLGAGKTAPGSIVGTPHYLAPEQLQGESVDARADIYACGVVFYEMFTGHLPFAGETPMEIISAHLRDEPAAPSVHWPEISQPLEQLILRCLAKRPEDRYPAVESLGQELESLRA
ncbi:MAG: protein kinase [Deltaproteobacteria bacterium]|nr:protein kinase [Deltaproteobacteria bacterium]